MPPISSTTKASPVRGEIWDVDLDPTKGAEIKKVRPVVVVSSDALRSLPLRLVAPITGWRDQFKGKFSHVLLKSQERNGLHKDSAVDALQLRGVALERFKKKRGSVSADEMEEIACAIAAVIEYC
ncbi:MAG: type II toxin-antitoxin system PemK/MazF family toxin [Candidatus Omnitrophica bacterium]|nr:type II toxin-antitoxin system PemK/MazF family toxin [Candidatus Omnitrophota bacterium]